MQGQYIFQVCCVCVRETGGYLHLVFKYLALLVLYSDPNMEFLIDHILLNLPLKDENSRTPVLTPVCPRMIKSPRFTRPT